MRTTLAIEIDYDPALTDPGSLATVADRLIETALSTPRLLNEYGNPRFGKFSVLSPSLAPEDRDQAAGDLLAKADAAGLTSEDLDEIVHDLTSSIAGGINNEGMERQLGYLIDEWGREAVAVEIARLAEEISKTTRAGG